MSFTTSVARQRIALILLFAALVALTAACGGGDGSAEDAPGAAEESSVQDGADDGEGGDELADGLATGGGGTLVFDGEEIPIDSVTCQSSGEDFSVGTVSDNGFRVFIDSSSTGTPSSQILDPDANQWTPLDRGASVEIGEGTYSTPLTTYSDIRDSSREVEVSYTIECP
jgi:hypothetical protein